MAALGIGWPLLSVWHPAVGFSSHSKDCWYSAGSRGETPTTNLCPPLQGPYRLLSCPCSLYSAGLYHLLLECSICVTSACASKCSALAPDPFQAPSSIWAFVLQTSILAISSVISQVLKLNTCESDFSRSTNSVECSSHSVMSLLKNNRDSKACPYLMFPHPHGDSGSELLLCWAAGRGLEDRNRWGLLDGSLAI